MAAFPAARFRRLPACIAATRATGIVCPSATRSAGSGWRSGRSCTHGSPSPKRRAAVRTVTSPGRTASSSSHVTGPDGRSVSLRRLLCDLIEEYGRHTGHADLLREAVDGRVGE